MEDGPADPAWGLPLCYLTGVSGWIEVLEVTSEPLQDLLEAIIAKMPRPYHGSAHHTHDQMTGGRRIVREIWVAAADGINFPHTRQVFRIRRQVFDLSGHRLSKEYVHGVTSLNSEAASPKQLLDTVRRHWRRDWTANGPMTSKPSCSPGSCMGCGTTVVGQRNR